MIVQESLHCQMYSNYILYYIHAISVTPIQRNYKEQKPATIELATKYLYSTLLIITTNMS